MSAAMDDPTPTLRPHEVRAKVTRTLETYCWCLDARDLPALSSVFDDDCVICIEPGAAPSHVLRGLATYLEWLTPRFERFASTRHTLSAVTIEVGPTVATATSEVAAWHQFTDRPGDGWLWGEYSDILARRGNAYVIVHRTFRILRMDGM
jgi:SnoaL-like domain